MTTSGRDRLRELLDAVLAGTDVQHRADPRPLAAMADDAATSPFHLNRLLSRSTGEPPVALPVDRRARGRELAVRLPDVGAVEP